MPVQGQGTCFAPPPSAGLHAGMKIISYRGVTNTTTGNVNLFPCFVSEGERRRHGADFSEMAVGLDGGAEPAATVRTLHTGSRCGVWSVWTVWSVQTVCVCVGGGRLSDWMAELSQSQPPSAHFSQVDMGRSEVWGGWLLGSSLCACIGPSARSVRSPSCPIQRVPSNPSGSNPPPDQWPEVP